MACEKGGIEHAAYATALGTEAVRHETSQMVRSSFETETPADQGPLSHADYRDLKDLVLPWINTMALGREHMHERLGPELQTIRGARRAPHPTPTLVRALRAYRTLQTRNRVVHDTYRDMFEYTDGFERFLDDHTWLVFGHEGTAERMLFRLFVEQPDQARQIAAPADLTQTTFVAAHGSPHLASTVLTASDLDAYAKRTQGNWDAFWRNYSLLRLVRELPSDAMQQVLDPRWAELFALENGPQIVDWLVRQSQNTMNGAIAGDQWRRVDEWLETHQKKVWLLYDELDEMFGDDQATRTAALNSLGVWWAEMGKVFSGIVPKLFIKKETYGALNFTNIAHVMNHALTLNKPVRPTKRRKKQP